MCRAVFMAGTGENLAVARYLGGGRSQRSLRRTWPGPEPSDSPVVTGLRPGRAWSGGVRRAPAVEDSGYRRRTLTGRRLLEFRPPREPGPPLLASSGWPSAGLRPRAPRARRGSGGRLRSVSGPDVRAADGTWRHVESTLLRTRAPGRARPMLVTARDVEPTQVALSQQAQPPDLPRRPDPGLPNRPTSRAGPRPGPWPPRRRGGRLGPGVIFPGPGPLHRRSTTRVGHRRG